MRSFFPEICHTTGCKTAYDYYYKQAKKYWVSQIKYMQGMIALSLSRSNDAITAEAIIESLKETCDHKRRNGHVLERSCNGWYYWYQAPIESQAYDDRSIQRNWIKIRQQSMN